MTPAISYSLWTSSRNSVTGNTGDYPFTANLVLANGSSNNTVDGNSFGTADFVGVLVADPAAVSSALWLQLKRPDHTQHRPRERSDGTRDPLGRGSRLPRRKSSFSTPPPRTRSLPISFGRTPATTSMGAGDARPVLSSSALSPTPVTVCNVFPATPQRNGNVWVGDSFKTQDVCPGGVLQQ